MDSWPVSPFLFSPVSSLSFLLICSSFIVLTYRHNGDNHPAYRLSAKPSVVPPESRLLAVIRS